MFAQEIFPRTVRCFVTLSPPLTGTLLDMMHVFLARH